MAPDFEHDLRRWMSFADDATTLAGLTIPGSHDSGALHEILAGTTTCQDLSIRAQLDIGVRYLDIRLRHYGDALLIHHGPVYQHANFDDVLIHVTAFLRTNPSETVIMEVSSEYKPADNTQSFEHAFMRHVNNPAYLSSWWRESFVPELGDVRGKIVLLRRFPGTSAVSGGIDVTGWQDDTQFTLTDTRGVNIVVQDRYRVTSGANDHKWSAITDMFEQAAGDTNGAWHLNFTSGFRSILGVPNITGVAGDINDRLFHYFDAETRNNVHFGTVISDFVSKEIVRRELRSYFS